LKIPFTAPSILSKVYKFSITESKDTEVIDMPIKEIKNVV
jgi:hypothetical protein